VETAEEEVGVVDEAGAEGAEDLKEES